LTVAILVVKLNRRSITYCARAKAGCGIGVAVGVSVGRAVFVGEGSVAEGSEVSVGRTVTAVGAAHEVIIKMQMHESRNFGLRWERMENILLDYRHSLNRSNCFATLAAILRKKNRNCIFERRITCKLIVPILEHWSGAHF
jgi:hypothetical protein